jgi:hypothetical protein
MTKTKSRRELLIQSGAALTAAAAQSSPQRAFESYSQHPAAILHAHRRSVSRGQRFRRALLIPYRCWRSH